MFGFGTDLECTIVATLAQRFFGGLFGGEGERSLLFLLSI